MYTVMFTVMHTILYTVMYTVMSIVESIIMYTVMYKVMYAVMFTGINRVMCPYHTRGCQTSRVPAQETVMPGDVPPGKHGTERK